MNLKGTNTFLRIFQHSSLITRICVLAKFHVDSPSSWFNWWNLGTLCFNEDLSLPKLRLLSSALHREEDLSAFAQEFILCSRYLEVGININRTVVVCFCAGYYLQYRRSIVIHGGIAPLKGIPTCEVVTVWFCNWKIFEPPRYPLFPVTNSCCDGWSDFVIVVQMKSHVYEVCRLCMLVLLLSWIPVYIIYRYTLITVYTK